MSGLPQITSRREARHEWYEADPSEHVWLADWRAHKLPHCSVYVIAPEGHWPSKVGIAVCAKKRVQGLQTSHWKQLVVSACFYAPSIADARKVEQKVHAMLKEERAYLLGEWFDKTAAQAAQVVEFAGDLLGIELRNRIEEPAVLATVTEIALKERYLQMQLDRGFGMMGLDEYDDDGQPYMINGKPAK